jgi:hypothetical protein
MFGFTVKRGVIDMQVKKIPKNNFLILLDYIFKKCNYVSLSKHYYNNICGEDICNIILEEEKISRKDFCQKYTFEDISTLCKLYEKNDRILLLIQPFYKNRKIITMVEIDIIHGYISLALEQFFYKYNIQIFLDKYLSEVKYVKNLYLGLEKEITPHGVEYYLEITDEIEKYIINKGYIWNFVYPYGIEDICFLKNNQYWLKSIAHEKLCFIYCESEEEYNYLKSIGIEFCEEEYKPITEEKRKEIIVDGLKI